MNWTCHRLAGALGEFRSDWDALNRSAFGDHPLLDATFIELLLQHFPAGAEHLCIQRGAEGITAMLIVHPLRGGRWATFLPPQAQISAALVRRPVDMQGLLRCLPGIAGIVDVLSLDPLISGHGPLPVHTERSDHALTMAIDLGMGVDAWWASRPRGLRQNLGRYGRRVGSAGLAPRHVVLTDAPDMAEAVARFGILEAQGWKGAEGTALSEGNGQLAFYGTLMGALAGRGQAQVHELWFGQTLAASRLMITGGNRVVALKTTYAERLKEYAPGRLLMLHMIRAAFAAWPDRTLEFYTNASADQLAWATSQRHIVHSRGYRAGPARALMDGWRRFKVLSARFMAEDSQPEGQVTTIDHPDLFPPELRVLFAMAEGDDIQNGRDWYLNLTNTVANRLGQVRFYVLWRDGQPLAALPTLTEHANPGQLQALGNFYTTLFEPICVTGGPPTFLTPLLRHLLRQQRSLGSLHFAPMDPGSPAYSMLRASLKACGLPTFEYFCHGNWYLPVTTDWPTYLADRPGKLRSTIARMGKKLRAENARIEILSAEADVERGLAGYLQVYSRSWKQVEPFPDFMPGLIRLSARRGWLRLGLVTIGEQAVAAQLWIVANGQAKIYKLAYDEDFKALAPGTVLSAALMQHAIEVDRVTEIDYLIGDDPYKAQWVSHRRERWGLVAYNLWTPAGLAGCLKEAVWRGVKRLRARLPGRTVSAAAAAPDHP